MIELMEPLIEASKWLALDLLIYIYLTFSLRGCHVASTVITDLFLWQDWATLYNQVKK